MRLFLSVLRNDLPPVNLIFRPKGLNPTVAEVLKELHNVVPLEDENGHWGLEDYVVELAVAQQPHITHDTSNGSEHVSRQLVRRTSSPSLQSHSAPKRYELLHYMLVEDVLQDGDEVVIRPLASQEVTEQELGGRRQIRADGRHLIDGIAWGRKRLKSDTGRPEVDIPPRKKRRLETEDVSNKRPRLIENGPSSDDEDDNFLPDANGDEGAALMIKEYAEFEDADADKTSDAGDSDTSSDGSDEDAMDEDTSDSDSGLEDELEGLLEDANEGLDALEKGRDVFLDFRSTRSSKPPTPTKSGKTKRDAGARGDDDDASDNSADFEGFSTPGSGRKHSARSPRGAANAAKDESTSSESSSESDSDSDETSSSGSGSESSSASSVAEQNIKKTLQSEVRRPRRKVVAAIDGSDSDSSTSTSSNDSNSDSPGHDVLMLKEEEDTSSSDSSSDTDSDSGLSDSTSSSESSEDEEEPELERNSVELPTPNAKLLEPFKLPSATRAKPSVIGQSPPGFGTQRTHNNNTRVKRRRQLTELKEKGLLGSDADFSALDAYLAAQVGAELADRDVEARKVTLIEELDSGRGSSDDDMDTREEEKNDKADSVDVTAHERPETVEGANDEALGRTPPNVNIQEESVSESPKKRARLDVASTRRLVFGALGVRAPTTPAAEQALREKLSQTGRKQVQPAEIQADSVQESGAFTAANDNDWESRVIISAVECEALGLKLKPPPFPFKQGWDHEAKARLKRYRSTGRLQDLQGEEDVSQYAPDVSMVDTEAEVRTPTIESRTVSADHIEQDDITYPADISILADLKTEHVVPGTIIAFRELHITPSNEPEISDYRIARIMTVDQDGVLSLHLSKRDRDAALQAKYDPVTGERSYSRFDLQTEDEDLVDDEGDLTKSLEELLETKLVELAKHDDVDQQAVTNVVTEDSLSAGLDVDKAIPEAANLHESALSLHTEEHMEVEINITTPRRAEITSMIREAGFDSAIDEDLLQPEPRLRGGDGHESPSNALSQTNSKRSSRQRSTDPVATSHQASASGFESPEFNDWMSSRSQKARNGDIETTGDLEADIQETGIGSEFTSQAVASIAHGEVQYPHVAQLEANSIIPTAGGESSSHQDAQHVTPLVEIEEVDITRLNDESEFSNNFDHFDGAGGLDMDQTPPSVVEETQPAQEQPGQHSSPSLQSFLDGRALDGPPDFSVDDLDDDLPSLSMFTVSQRRKINPTISPPPTKRGHKTKSSAPPKFHNASDDDDEDIVSNPYIKVSASQARPSPRLSQIPELPKTNGNKSQSSFIDLTMSSDPVSPGNSDGEFWARDSGRTKGKGSTMSLRSKGKQRASLVDEAEAPSADEQFVQHPVENGLGQRKLLVKRKIRSMV